MAQQEKSIRVCFVSPKVYPLLNPSTEGVFGGAEVDVYMIGTELAKDNSFNISYITADYGQIDHEQIENTTLFKSFKLRDNPIKGAFTLWQAMKRAHADIYFLKTASPGVPLVFHFCRSHRKTLIYRTAHSDECDGTYKKRHPFLGRVFEHVLRNASAVLSQNEQDADNLRKTIGVDSTVIRNAHRIADAYETGQRNTILWIGRSADFKKPGRFLELARRCPDQSFVMICQRATGDAQYDQLQKDAAGIDNLTFLSRVSFHETDQYFRQAKILVNTSDAEGFSNTFIQAAKWGVPILSYRVNPDNFLAAFSCGLACDGDSNRMEQGLRFLLSNDKFIEIGTNARRYAEQHHDIFTVIEQYKALFRRLLGQ
ncbi:MAG: glycosyltransferase family 4 protein [Sedimentisphaerales bacterium]|nr:glycosyltransferase family 4 protein [Sedimentisphaerales bacterium]